MKVFWASIYRVPSQIEGVRFINAAKHYRPWWLRWLPYPAYCVEYSTDLRHEKRLSFPASLVVPKGVCLTCGDQTVMRVNGLLTLNGKIYTTASK